MSQSPTLHYAWVVALVTGLVLLAAAGVRTAPQVLIKPLEAEFGWDRASISLAVAASIIWFGLGAPLSGTLVGRFGLPRRRCSASWPPASRWTSLGCIGSAPQRRNAKTQRKARPASLHLCAFAANVLHV
jgi:hypothetical protein